MFRENREHFQESFFSTVSSLPKTVLDLLKKSWATIFYERIFCKINEKKFSVLFSKKKSRSNFPINIYLSLEIMKSLFDWTDEQMLSNFYFNLQVCYAVGLKNLGEKTLAPRTLYYHRNRVLSYEKKRGINLFEEIFKDITLDELRAFGIDTSIQRMDSSMISSNIRKMSRLEIAIKVLQNFFRSLSEEQRQHHYDKVKDYLQEEADTVTYKLKNSELDYHLKRVGELLLYFYTLYQENQDLKSKKSYAHLKRILDEQFSVSEDQSDVVLKPCEEITTDSLQNPADDEATYRRKHNQDYQGYVLNIAETCAEDNPMQLITDVSVYTNNTSDDRIIQDRLEPLKEQTDVQELVVDGAYSGEDSESACEKQQVELIFTGIKGAKLHSNKIGLQHFQLDENGIVACPQGQRPISQRYNAYSHRYVAHFDKEQCSQCPLRAQCCVLDRKNFTTLYFSTRQLHVAKKRLKFSTTTYQKKQKLRPAIEGTISLFKRRTYNGKLRVRGFNKVRNVVILTALAINFQRIRANFDAFFDSFYNLLIIQTNLCKIFKLA